MNKEQIEGLNKAIEEAGVHTFSIYYDGRKVFQSAVYGGPAEEIDEEKLYDLLRELIRMHEAPTVEDKELGFPRTFQ